MIRGLHLPSSVLLLGLMLASHGYAGSVLDTFGTNAPSAKSPATNSPPAANLFSQPIVLDPVAQAMQEAKQLAAGGQLDASLQKVNVIIQDHPKTLDAWILRGDIHVDQKKWDLAQKDFATALQIDGNNFTVKFNLAEIEFRQKNYDGARSDFAALQGDPDFGDLAAYKVFLCDLVGGHEDMAQKELTIFNLAEANPSYYFGNVAWDLTHKKTEDARDWLTSAVHIYAPKKIFLYGASLKDLGYLPLPSKPATP